MCAVAMEVPLPVNGSYTTSPLSLNAFTKNSTSARGNGAECDPWLPSALASITLLGQAMPAVFSAPQPSRPEPLGAEGLSDEYTTTSSDSWPAAFGRNLISLFRQK